MKSVLLILMFLGFSVNAQTAQEYGKSAIKKAENGDLYGAIADFTKQIEINPKDFIAFMNRGISKSSLGDHSGAMEDFTKSIKIEPNYADPYINRGLSKDYYSAISDFTRAIAIKSDSEIAYYDRGISKYNLGDMRGACKDARKARDLGLDSAINLINEACK